MISKFDRVFLASGRYTNNRIFVLMSILIVSLIIDTALSRISNLGIDQLFLSDTKLAIFIAITVVYTIGQYVMLGWVLQKRREFRIRKESSFNIVITIVTVFQYVLAATIIITIFQILTRSYYSTVWLIVGATISYTLAAVMMGLLARRFFSWFKSNKNSVVLSYGLASAMFIVNLIVTLVFVSSLLMDRPTEIREFLGFSKPFFSSGSLMNTLDSMYIISSIISFLLMWSATVLLLRHYSHRLGIVKYWIIVSIPLVYFLSQFTTLFLNEFVTLLGLSPSFFATVNTLIFTLSKPAGGILFGISFWTIAKNIRDRNIVRDYMIISAYGFVLLFISEQAIVLTYLAYPPFGFVTISFMGLSSFLIFTGIYSAAISVAQDSNLRKSIRNFAINESKLLDSIGTAQMEQEVQKKVITFTKQNQARIEEETGIETSLSDQDIERYLEQVIKEIKHNHKQ